jgi:hypothetical protein
MDAFIFLYITIENTAEQPFLNREGKIWRFYQSRFEVLQGVGFSTYFQNVDNYPTGGFHRNQSYISFLKNLSIEYDLLQA